MDLTALKPLQAEVKRLGWDRRATGRLLLELGSHVFLSLAGMALFVAFEHPLARVAALLVTTAGAMGVLTSTHTTSHYATSSRRWVNDLLLYFGYTFFWGVTSSYWKWKHVIVHHPAPNVIGVDRDADFMPWVALTELDVAESRGWRRWYYVHLQRFVFPLILGLLGFGMQSASWGYLLRQLRDPALRKPSHWIDLGVLVLHYVVWVGLPMLFWPPLGVIAFYAVRVSLTGYVVFGVSAPGHLPAYAACVDPQDECNDYLMRQIATTANFRTGPIGRWFCSGLEYQIEHHIFPNMSHTYYPRLSPLVQDLCRRHGVPYHSYSWGEAMWRVFKVLAAPKRIEPQLEGLRLSREVVVSDDKAPSHREARSGVGEPGSGAGAPPAAAGAATGS